MVTALQYWVPHYLRVVLGASNEVIVVLVGVTIISATAVGSLVGAAVTIKCLGSYTNPKAIYLCLALYLLYGLAASPMSFINSETFGKDGAIYVFASMMWIVMFSHGFIEPIFTGILLSSTADANVASSVIIFSQMIFGFIPAPYVYGLLLESIPKIDPESGENQSIWGMRGVTFFSIVGVISLFLATLFKVKNKQGENKSLRDKLNDPQDLA